MGKVFFMKKGPVHTEPVAPVFLKDENGNLVTANATDTDTK